MSDNAMPEQKNAKNIILAALLLVVLAGIFIVIWLTTKPKTEAGGKTITVSVIGLDGEVAEHSITTDEEFLADALREAKLIDGVDSGLGFMVTSVDGVTADDSKEQWWKLTVGGEFSEYGASDLPIKDGGRYEWTLTEGWEW